MLSEELRRLRLRINPDEGRVARALIEELKAAEARALMLENQKRQAKARACITLEAGGNVILFPVIARPVLNTTEGT